MTSTPPPPPPLYDPIPRAGSRRRRRRTRASDSKTKVEVLHSILEENIDKSSDIYQKTAWIILQRSIYNLLNKINTVSDVWKIYEKLIQLNIFRGRGMFCRLIMDDNLYSNQNRCNFAALVSLINVHFPIVGELLLTRLIFQFQNSFQQNDKFQCLSSAAFIAHLINQNVADTNLAFDIVQFLLRSPTENSIEIFGMIWSICGHKVCKTNKKKMNMVTETMKKLLRDKRLDNKVQCMIKISLKMIRKNRFTSQKFIIVLNDNKHTHVFDLNNVFDPQNNLDYYLFDSEYETNEYIYELFCQRILEIHNEKYVLIYDTDDEIDSSDKENLLKEKLDNNLALMRRTLTLIVNSSYSYENSALKLMDAKLKPGQELEVGFMLLNFCCQHKIYNESLGYATQILCQLNKSLVEPLEDIFIETYATVHEFDKIKLRNVAKFFAHLLFTDTISWMVLSTIEFNEINTTHSSKTYFNILFQELVEHMELDVLNDRIQDSFLKEAFKEILLGDDQHNPKFAIDCFLLDSL